MEDAAVGQGCPDAGVPDPVVQTQGFLGILGGIVDDEAGVVHGAPLIPVRAVGNEPDAVFTEAVLHGVLHGPVDLLDVVVGRHGVQGAEHLGQIHDVVGVEEGDPVFKPLFAVLVAQILGVVLLGNGQDDFLLRFHDLFVALQGQVHEGALLGKADDLLDNGDSLRLVEQADDGGLYRLDDFPAGLIAGVDVGEQEGVVGSDLGLLDDLELGLGHDAQGALGAHKEGNQVGAAGMLGHGQGIDNVAVGQSHFQRQAHIIHFAVLGGQNADAVVGQRAAHGAAGQAGGQVHDGIAQLVDPLFQSGENDAGFAGDVARFHVDVDDLVHALDVQQDAAGHRQRAALAAGAAAPGGDGDFIVVGDFQNLGDLLGAAGTDDDVRHGAGFTGILPFPAQPEIVHGIDGPLHFPG